MEDLIERLTAIKDDCLKHVGLRDEFTKRIRELSEVSQTITNNVRERMALYEEAKQSSACLEKAFHEAQATSIKEAEVYAIAARVHAQAKQRSEHFHTTARAAESEFWRQKCVATDEKNACVETEKELEGVEAKIIEESVKRNEEFRAIDASNKQFMVRASLPVPINANVLMCHRRRLHALLADPTEMPSASTSRLSFTKTASTGKSCAASRDVVPMLSLAPRSSSPISMPLRCTLGEHTASLTVPKMAPSLGVSVAW